MALIMNSFFFLYTTPGRIPFTFRCRYRREVNTCILLYLLIFPFILQKAGQRARFLSITLLVSSLLLLYYSCFLTLCLILGFGASGWAGARSLGWSHFFSFLFLFISWGLSVRDEGK